MYDFAQTMLEQALCTPSHAVPNMFPAAFSQTALGLSTHSSFAAPSSDAPPHPTAAVDARAGPTTASSGDQKAMHEDSHDTTSSVAALARATLMGLHCEGLIAGNIDAGASLKLAAQMRHHIASAAAALCPRVARLVAAAGSSGTALDAVEQDAQDAASKRSQFHKGVAASSNTRNRSSAHGSKRKGGKSGRKHKGAHRNAGPPAGTIPPLLPAAARPLQRCVTLKEGSTHVMTLFINMHGQDKSALVVYFQVRAL